MDYMIGKRIKDRRKELHITQTQIQEAIGISSGNLSGIENGKYLPSTAALLGLSKILDCSIDWILTGESLKSTNDNISDFKDNSDIDMLIKYFQGMSDTDREEILLFAQLKYNRNQNSREQRLSPFEPETNTNEIA